MVTQIMIILPLRSPPCLPGNIFVKSFARQQAVNSAIELSSELRRMQHSLTLAQHP
jgi:hypothetical protein